MKLKRTFVFVILCLVKLQQDAKNSKKERDGMRATNKSDNLTDRISVSSEELALILGCGRKMAVETGTAARAKVQLGNRRVLWNVKKVQEYLDALSE